MKKAFDLVTIGTGSAASAVATRSRRAGWSVAVIDYRPFGGTCALRGCDPKKVLVGAAEAIEWTHRLAGKGIRSDGLHIDWPELMRFKRQIIEAVPGHRDESFARAGIETFHGQARFVGRNILQVGDDMLEARHILIASGARPAKLRIPGEEHLINSEHFLELDELPRRIVFVGGGYISFEFAHVTARAGAQVTILHRGRQPLDQFDPDLVTLLIAKSRQIGIDVCTDTAVTGIEKKGETLSVIGIRAGSEQRFEAEMVVHGAGRVPDIDDLDLEAGGVERAGPFIKLNEFLQSVSNPAVYAAGDAAGVGPALTPVAGYDGRIVAANLLEENHQSPEYSVVPSVVFTVPPLARVGLSEQEAVSLGLRFKRNLLETSSWYSSRRLGETHSGFKVLVEEPTGRILGAHLLGPGAEETINLFAMAMRAGLTAQVFKETFFGYPTHASDVPYMV